MRYVSKIKAKTGFNHNFVKKIVARLDRHNTTTGQKRGGKTVVTEEMLDYIQFTFEKSPQKSFNQVYFDMLEHFGLDSSFVSRTTVQCVFKRRRRFSRKRIIPVNKRAIT